MIRTPAASRSRRQWPPALRSWTFLGVVLLIQLGAALGVRAAEGANSSESSATGIFKWINFAIVAGAIVYLARRFGPSFFRSRAEKITFAITEATAVKAEADRLLKDAEGRLARLDQEVTALRSSAANEAAAEAERIRALARIESERITAAALAEIEAAERAARLELKALGAKLAVEGAESLLQKQLSAKAQESLFRAFVQSLEARPN